jgi:putative SOS response-associated peptidase YedK
VRPLHLHLAFGGDPADVQIRSAVESRTQLQCRPNTRHADCSSEEGRSKERARHGALGLIPHWAKDKKIAYSTINARSETAATKPAFRDAFKRQRCLVVADAIYAWRRDGEEKWPQLIRLKGGGPFAFAGLWSTWRSPEGEDIESYTIMTTEPHDFMARSHNRMPVILGQDDHDRGLDLDADPTHVLKPCLADWLEAFPVDKRVGDVRNNDPDLIRPI